MRLRKRVRDGRDRETGGPRGLGAALGVLCVFIAAIGIVVADSQITVYGYTNNPLSSPAVIPVAVIVAFGALVAKAAVKLHANKQALRDGQNQDELTRADLLVVGRYATPRERSSRRRRPGPVCPNCNAPTQVDYAYCSECGEPLGTAEAEPADLHPPPMPEAEVPVQAEHRECSYCGSPAEIGKMCQQCGAGK